MSNKRKIFASLLFLLLCSNIPIFPVFAAQSTNEGILFGIYTDKTTYAKDETIQMTVILEHEGMSPIFNVELKTFLPNGYSLDKNDSLLNQVNDMNKGDNVNLTVHFIPDNKEEEIEDVNPPETNVPDSDIDNDNSDNESIPDNTPAQTGDDTPIVIWIILASCATCCIIVLFLWKKKNDKTFLSILLCAAMISGLAWPVTSAEASITKTYTYSAESTVQVDEECLTLRAELTYSMELPETFTVIFETNGRSAMYELQVAEGNSLLKPEDPKREGYIFVGWYEDEKLTKLYCFDEKLTKDITLYAKWETTKPVPGVTPDVKPSMTPTPELVPTTTPIPTITVTPVSTGNPEVTLTPSITPIPEITVAPTPAVTPTPTVTPSVDTTYIVSFNSCGGSSINSQTIKNLEKVTEPEIPVYEGNIFAGWYVDEECTYAYDFENCVTGNMMLYAKWISSDAEFSVAFVSDGENIYETQEIKIGKAVLYPGIPEKDNYMFAGWYQDINETDYTQQYDFTQPVVSDLTLYAVWVDKQEDIDKDGLPDKLEHYFGTDENMYDSDLDGLNDYYECIELGTDPLKSDTDNDGIIDGNEDADNDGLINRLESAWRTSMIAADSDFDGIKDGDEIYIYKTWAHDEDTDNDGAEDKWELDNGFDPLTYDTLFNITKYAESVFATVSVNSELNAEKAATLSVEPVIDHIFLKSNIAGYLDIPFEFNVDCEPYTFNATITFELKDTLNLENNACPTIYHFNEEKQFLEECLSYRDGNKIYTRVSHFSTYILLDKTKVDEFRKQSFVEPLSPSEMEQASMDVVFAIDYSASMKENDPAQRFKKLSVDYIKNLRDNKDQVGLVTFIAEAYALSNLTTDKTSVVQAINSVHYDDGTNINGPRFPSPPHQCTIR